MQGQALDAGQCNVLGNLNTKTPQADNKDVGGAHTLHGLVTEHVELSAVQRFIDLALANGRVVDLEASDEVDFFARHYGVLPRTVLRVSSCYASLLQSLR